MFFRRHRNGSVTRTALALVLLVFIVGGIAYLGQNLRRWNTPPENVPQPEHEKTKIHLEFTNSISKGSETRVLAVWDKHQEEKVSKEDGPAFYYKEFESGTRAHYDFLFRNVAEHDLELGLQTSSCDCASVQAAVVSPEEWQRLRQQQDDKPGDALTYSADPNWHELSADAKAKPLPLKAGEHGIVRASGKARKPAGQNLNLYPQIWTHPAGKPGERQYHQFIIPGVMTRSVRVFPQRVSVGSMAGGTTSKAEFQVWSPTREALDLKLVGDAPDPLVDVETKPLSQADCAKLAARLNADKDFLAGNNKMPTRVLTAYHVTVTVHESRAGKQLDQGVFLRTLPIIVDGIANPDLPGPEIIGRALGDIEVGGADDMGKIRFKSFDSKAGATKEVDVSADSKAKLELFDQHPQTLKVQLTPDPKNSTPERSRWKLKVTVPPNTFAGSFTEADVVRLRIQGEPPRFVRIQIEGNVGGR